MWMGKGHPTSETVQINLGLADVLHVATCLFEGYTNLLRTVKVDTCRYSKGCGGSRTSHTYLNSSADPPQTTKFHSDFRRLNRKCPADNKIAVLVRDTSCALTYPWTHSLLHFAEIASMSGAQPSVIVVRSFVPASNFATDAETCTSRATDAETCTSRATDAETCTSRATDTETCTSRATDAETCTSRATDAETCTSRATDAETCTSRATDAETCTSRATMPHRCTVLFSPEMFASFSQINPTTDEK
uniref:Bm9399 n=1 Tax=Brugia malayi TaxID=6279 RepID=A0A0J9XS22_BRUMA|nr:Bm9399 [Brugia malayi]